jgi:hypothetical protein
MLRTLVGTITTTPANYSTDSAFRASYLARNAQLTPQGAAMLGEHHNGGDVKFTQNYKGDAITVSVYARDKPCEMSYYGEKYAPAYSVDVKAVCQYQYTFETPEPVNNKKRARADDRETEVSVAKKACT